MSDVSHVTYSNIASLAFPEENLPLHLHVIVVVYA
jgi:hypothetical protein